MTQIEQILAEIDRLKANNEKKKGACAAQIAMSAYCKEEAYDEVIEYIKSLPSELSVQPVREYPSSTEMIRLWNEETLPMLKEKDFRGDAQRMAYVAFLEGFAKGLSCKPLEKPMSKDLEKYIEELNKLPIYFKIPMTTHYSGDLAEFDEKVTHIVEGTEFCETDQFGDKCCCWYVSSIFGTSNDKEWLLREIAELGYAPDIMDFRKGLFKRIEL